MIGLIRTGQLDEAEKVAHWLREDHPEVIDGHERLPMVTRRATIGAQQPSTIAWAYTSSTNPGDYNPEPCAHCANKLIHLRFDLPGPGISRSPSYRMSVFVAATLFCGPGLARPGDQPGPCVVGMLLCGTSDRVNAGYMPLIVTRLSHMALGEG